MFKKFTPLLAILVLVGFSGRAQQTKINNGNREADINTKIASNQASKKLDREFAGLKKGGRKVQNVSATSYCTPVHAGACTNWFVSYVGIETTPLSNPSTCGASGAYTVYDTSAANQTATLSSGTTYSIKVGLDGAAGVGQSVSLWIDYNQDFVFGENEWVLVTDSAGSGDTVTASFTVPGNAYPGPTGMRIRSRRAGFQNDSTSSCSTFGTGESEDYTLKIDAGSNVIVSTFSPAAGNAGTTVLVNGFNFNNVTGVKFNGVPATFTLGNSNQLTANVPVGATTGPITVYDPNSTANSPLNFQIGVYKIDSVVPAAARSGYPALVYTHQGSEVLKPQIDSIDFDSVTWVPSLNAYKVMVPDGVTAGKVTLGSGAFTGNSPNDLIILPLSYCAPLNVPDGGCIRPTGLNSITRVSIDSTSLNNTSDCENDFYFNTIAYAPTANTTAYLVKGKTYKLNVTTTFKNIVSVWVDWNNNGQYATGEWKQVDTATTPGTPSTINLLVPRTAKVGWTSMRIRSRLTQNPNAASDACTEFGSGETEEYMIEIHNALGAETILAGNKTGIYPNPNNGEFTLNLSDMGNSGTITITDAVGRVVYTRNLTPTDAIAEAKFDAGFLNAGIYSVEVKTATTRAIERMVIAK